MWRYKLWNLKTNQVFRHLTMAKQRFMSKVLDATKLGHPLLRMKVQNHILQNVKDQDHPLPSFHKLVNDWNGWKGHHNSVHIRYWILNQSWICNHDWTPNSVLKNNRMTSPVNSMKNPLLERTSVPLTRPFWGEQPCKYESSYYKNMCRK